ncbi:MAG: peptidyl-prolyl cis-trans isomerase [Candidatus Dadabacteria bacterium]|nr:peptidyl-prolyl cis-trans isomerase [Candidatus Dadabacteria bacterium]
MNHRTITFAFVIFLVLYLSSCSDDKVLARFDGHVITVDEYLWEKDNLPEAQRNSLRTIEAKKEFLNKIIVREMLLQEALRLGLQNNETIRYKIENYRRNLLINELLNRQIEGETVVTDKEVKSYYEAHKDQFTTETVEASYIVVRTREDAEMIMALLKRGESFSDLAKKFSIGPGAESGGSIGEITPGQMIPEFEEALFALEKPGDISPIIETDFGYHIIRLDKTKTTRTIPYDEASKKIRELLTDQKEKQFFENFVEKLEKGITIEINDDLLKEL